MASTPKGRDNLFAQLRDNERFTRSVVTLDDAIAAGLDIDADEIKRSMNDDRAVPARVWLRVPRRGVGVSDV